MQIVEIINSTVYFETDKATGTCEYVITDPNLDWDVKINQIKAIEDDTELEYILTDEEEIALIQEVYDYVNEHIIDDILDRDNYFDEDECRYND